MALSGVYKVIVTQFENQYSMELHISLEGSQVYASLKDGVLNRSFYNGSVNGAWNLKDSNSFLFRNAQIDEYVDVKYPDRDPEHPVNLTPPGGYHVGGVELAGTVFKDHVTAVIKLYNGLIISMEGDRIPDREPVVTRVFREDCISGVNRFCTCGTGSCTHHGFCDSCHIFESIHCTPALPGSKEALPEGVEMPPMFGAAAGGRLPASQCMNKQQDKLFGPMPAFPVIKPEGFVEHGPHHLAEDGE